jgi:hypothetical protein
VLIAFLLVHARRGEKRRHDMVLSEAWRVVLDDPHYEHRKRYEEKLREDDRRLKKEHAMLRKKEGLSREVPPDPPSQ